MAIVIEPKNKKQEKILKAFLKSMDIEFGSIVMEDEPVYKTRTTKTKTAKEKQVLDNLSQSVEFVKKYKKGKVKAKTINQLLNEL
jgi:hypothetical protein